MPTSDFTPTVDMVGAILRARTKTAGGSEVGTFNSETRPTDVEVQDLAQTAVADLMDAVGPDIADAPGDDPDAYRNGAKRLAALGTAMLVELTYWPEQVATGRSPYAQLKTLYDDRLKRLVGLLFPGSGDAGSGGAGAGPGAEALPSGGGFPTTAIGMEFPW